MTTKPVDLPPSLTTRIEIHPGYDHRDDSDGRRGCHGASLWLVLTGDRGAIVAEISLGWMERPLDGPFMPGGPQRRRDQPGVDSTIQDSYPSGAMVVGHARRQHGDAALESHECKWLDGASCWNGGGGFGVADDVLAALVAGGDRAAFEFMAGLYEKWLPAVEGGAK